MANSTFPFISLQYIPSHFAEGTVGVARREFEATGSDVANFETGIPAIYSIPVKQGGKLVERGDINGIGWLATNLQVFSQNGGVITFDAAHATRIGGYEKGAILSNYTDDDGFSFVISTKDANLDNFVTDKTKVGDDKSWKQISPTLKDLSLKIDKASIDIASRGFTTSDDTHVPSSKLVSSKLDLKIDKSSIDGSDLTNDDNHVPSSKLAITKLGLKIDKSSVEKKSITETAEDKIPSSKAVSDALSLKIDKTSIDKTSITETAEDKVPSSKAVSDALADKIDNESIDSESLSTADNTHVPSSKLISTELALKVDSSSIEKDSIESPDATDKIPSSKAVSAALDEINLRIELTNDYSFKGAKASESDLPKSGNTANDVWVTMDDGSYWAYVSRKWTKIEATMGLLMKHIISLQNEVIALQGTP